MDCARVLKDEVSISIEELLIIGTVETIAVGADSSNVVAGGIFKCRHASPHGGFLFHARNASRLVELAHLVVRFDPLDGVHESQHRVTARKGGLRAIPAVSACNTRASIRPSVFGGVHAFHAFPC